MKKRILLLIALIALVTCLFCGCKSNPDKNIKADSSASFFTTDLGEGKNKFTFVVTDADGNQKAFNISTNKTIVGDALKEHNLISGEEGEFGLYVKTVDGKTYDYNKDGKYWAFYINGEYATTGVDKTQINKDDTYMFKVE
ncbi:MAG: DUF4430 domain-containing protein [Clostridia bacterium]|nr:DUF4430 domain-containing protein [Clostridia bacterium]